MRIWLLSRWRWAVAFLAICALPFFFAVAAGYFRPFTQVYDADLYYVYHALRFTSGLPQVTFDHTGYLHFLLLSWWFDAVGFIAALPHVTLGDILAADSPPHAVAQTVVSARVFSTVLTTAFVALLSAFFLSLSANRWAAATMAFVVASSSGVAYHSFIIRPELSSGILIVVAYATLLSSASAKGWRAYLLLALCACCAYLSVMSKMQGAIPALGLPLVGLLLRPNGEDVGPPKGATPALVAAILVFSLLLVLPLLTSMVFGVLSVIREQSLPVYFFGVVALVCGAPLAHAILYDRGRLATGLSMAAVLGGLGVANFVNYFHWNILNNASNALFVDMMSRFVHSSGEGSAGILSSLAGSLVSGSLWAEYFSLEWWAVGRLMVLVTALAGGLALLRVGRWRPALVVLALTLGSVAVNLVFGLRGFRTEYDIYSLALPILGLAYCAQNLIFTVPTHLRIIGLGLLFGAALSNGMGDYSKLIAKPVFTSHRSLDAFCQWQKTYAPFFPPLVYDTGNCWTYYKSAISVEPFFPEPTKPEG